MVGRGRAAQAVVVVSLVMALAAPATLAQSPSPDAAPGPTAGPSSLRRSDTAQDDHFHLTIATEATQVALDGPPIQVDTTLAYIGARRSISVGAAHGGVVGFGVTQLDGPFDPGSPFRRTSRTDDTWQRGERRGIPFAKSGAFDADDPLADEYRAWFADPMLRLPVGTFEITAEVAYDLGDVASNRTLTASVVVEVTPGPSDRPFTWPLVPRVPDEPGFSAFELTEEPTATVTRDGLRMDLWLSTQTLAPGDWLQVAVRTSNVGRGPLWQYGDECGGYRTQLDASPLPRDRGAQHRGNAGEFKRRALRYGGGDAQSLWLLPSYRRWIERDGIVVDALAECGGSLRPPLARLQPGEIRWERFAAYAGRAVDHQPRFMEALPPGPVTVTVRWPIAGRGARPNPRWGDTRPSPIELSVPVQLTGDGPTSPTLGALLDTALADPTFRAWVDAQPQRRRWDLYVSQWPGPGYSNPRWQTVAGRAPYGMTEISLYHSGHGGHALLDTWTGELLDVVFTSYD